MSKKTSKKELQNMRHSAAHVLAAASRELKPETKLGVGPATANGFFHDIDVDVNWTEEDLPKLRKKMIEIKKKDLSIKQREISKTEAKEIFKNDPYKLEIINEIKEDKVGISDMGDGWFVSLCEGGHVESTSKIGEFKLTHLSGVYWQGDENKPQLQRIFGVLFPTKEELQQRLNVLEEAKKRDHRKLGKQLDLFTFSPLVGTGLPMFTPRGTVIREEIEKFIWALQSEFYQRVSIPHIAKPALYKTSGHWDKFSDDIFHVKGKNDDEFVLKPMNCPHHTQIYDSQKRSYRDLPIRYAEVTTVYRDEQAGELQGLTRVRSITQDDGHVFCRPDQIEEEINIILSIVIEFNKAFDLDHNMTFRLSLRDPDKPDKYLGDDVVWKQSQKALQDVLNHNKVVFAENVGEAAFYGPKIDLVVKDSLQREWQLATIQLDFNMPERFGLTYTDKEGKKQTPVMIHRAISGSLERFMAILLEHYAGALPLWLSPTQVKILPISDDQNKYAREILSDLKENNIRAEIDERSESIGKKIREAETMKTPIMLIIGKKEQAAKEVSVRKRGQQDAGTKPLPALIKELVSDIENRV